MSRNATSHSLSTAHDSLLCNDDNKRKGSRTRNFIDAKLAKHNGKFTDLTADNFLDIWKNYDRNASRFLERNEIRAFLKDFMNSALANLRAPRITENDLLQLARVFMDEFDENEDGKISIQELSAILPVRENFLVLFRRAIPPETGIDYMKIWKKYDKDRSGYIETDELKNFLKDLIVRAKKGHPDEINDEILTDYALRIIASFDTNKDGKLGLQELIRLLPAQENFVKQSLDKVQALGSLRQSDINKLLDRYDQDGNGTLEGSELSNLVRDILEDQATRSNNHYTYNAKDVYEIEKTLLKGCDRDGNGRIDRKELAVILLAIVRAGLSGIYSIDQFNREVQK